MQNTDRINSTQIDWDRNKPISFMRMLVAEINGADISKHRIHTYIIPTGAEPFIAHYFGYHDLAEETASLGVKVIMSSQVDTDRRDFVVQFSGLKNVSGIATSSGLHKRLEGDECLREVYELSTAEIERILEGRKRDYEIRGYVWENHETIDWNENVIEVRTKFQDFEEKEELWDILEDILETTQTHMAQVYHREIPEDRTLFVLHLSEMG